MAESDSEVDRKGKLSQSVDRHDEEKDETKHNGFKIDVHSHIFRCEHCDDFETNSNSLKALHIVNCSSINRKLDSEQECQNEATPSTSNSKKLLNPRKLFECDVCNMKFSNGANMRRHKMRHTGVKPYECRVCQKRFFRKDHLAEHFTTHTKTLPYHCPICNRGFQRQIAMRAHFQNEHVGQHDLVKTCPMCSYRAGTMKSLRAHFFNRHGIDLDNPGTGSSSTSSSLLLALSSQNNSQFNNFAPNKMSGVNYSDSGDSVRSMDNSTPPMNLLTPQVEIVTNETNETEKSEVNDLQNSSSEIRATRDQFQYSPPSSPYVDTNANIHPISHCTSKSVVDEDSIIKPSISIIPLENDHYDESTDNKYEVQKDLNIMEMKNADNKVSSMIKISPLKSLLREDLKRRIYSKANNKFSKNATNGNNNKSSSSIETNEENKCLTTFNPVFQSAQNETEMPTIHRRKILPCFFCGIEFPDQTLYFLHKGCHSESNPWKCNICGEQCNNVYEFNSHLLSKSHQ